MEKTRKLLIVGAGELAMIAYEYFTYDSSYEVVAFAVEPDYLTETELCDKPVLALEEAVATYPPEDHDAFVAIPSSQLNRVRTRLFEQMKSRGYRCATYISSRAFVWRNAKIGENCFIFEHNTIQPFVEVGDNVILWSGNHVGHRTVIERNCFISSHVVISGYCRIGESTFMGVNATVNDHVEIPRDCVIASGALVSKSLPEPEKIYFGAPAKAMPKKSALSVKL